MHFSPDKNFVTPGAEELKKMLRISPGEIKDRIELLKINGFTPGVELLVGSSNVPRKIIGYNTRQYGPHQVLTHPLVVDWDGEERLIGIDEHIRFFNES